LINTEVQNRDCEKFAHLLEKSSFSEINKYLTNLKTSDADKYSLFLNLLTDLDLEAEISDHMIALVKLVAARSHVVATQDDRMRILLFLAKANGKNLENTNIFLEEEFGDYFHLNQKYEISGKVITHKDVIKKATEILNGFKNICYFNAAEDIKETMFFFKNCTINDKTKLLQIRDATFSLIMKLKEPLIFFSKSGLTETRPELINYYKITNRTELETEALNNDLDQDKIAKFVYMMAEVVATKLELIEKNYAPNDFGEARTIISAKLANIVFKELMSYEEISRFGMPLAKST
jgi:hypothetical protein